MKMRFDRLEIAGSLGDIGTLLPLAVGMIMINGVSGAGLFFSVGLLYILGGLYYGVPIAVQPMKVISAYAIAMALTPTQISASGLIMGGFLLIIALTGAIDVISKIISKPIVRGVQLSTGTLLVSKGIGFVVGDSFLQEGLDLTEPYFSLQHLGPVPMGIFLGITGGLLTLFLLNNKRFPAGLVVVLYGLLAGTVFGTHEGLALPTALHLPQILPFGLPQGLDWSFALFALVLPQLPMTLGNAVIANRDLSNQLFGKDGRKVTDRSLCVSMGLANIVASLLGGMPLCHGAGGLAAHYRFGARTNGSNLIIGGVFIVLAVIFGSGIVAVSHLMPLSIFGVLLVFAGTQLAMSIADMKSGNELFIVMIIVGIALASNLAWGFLVGILLSAVLRFGRISI
ncbi:MAG: putative sulfate/molybdate transporter [Desulfovibrio sp.]